MSYAFGNLRAFSGLSAVLCLLTSIPAFAQTDPVLPSRAFEGVDAELMVQINDLGAQLRAPAGHSLRSVTSELGVFDRTSAAWESLSKALKMSPDSAVDHLLGGRVLLIADDVGGSSMRWACIMEVAEEVARLVPHRLKAAPRDTMDGRTVYAVEDGRFRVVQSPAVGSRGVATIAIAHADADSMLRAGAALGSRWVSRGPGKPGEGVAVVLYRPEPGSWLFGELFQEANGWRLSFSASPGLLGPSIPVSPTVSQEWFDAMSSESLLAFVGPVVRSDRANGDRGSWFDMGPSGLIWRLLPFEPPEAFVRDGDGLASVTINSVGGGRLDCSVGFLVKDTARAAKVGDEYVCDILEGFTGSHGYGENSPLCTGTFPGAARLQTVDLEEDNDRRKAYGPRLSFVWGVRADANRRGSGWWTMRILSENVPDATATLLRYQTPVRIRGRADERALMAGRIRPADLLNMISAGSDSTSGLVGPLSSLRWIDELFWRIDEPGRGGGALSGELVLQMRPAP